MYCKLTYYRFSNVLSVYILDLISFHIKTPLDIWTFQ
uniref:Uncharacterized protein n=1 Tax=Anguilla anguilla TaxID=7936 RepID=A0A0E9SFK2_ANGAN